MPLTVLKCNYIKCKRSVIIIIIIIITDNRKFWKYIKPSFSDKIAISSNLILYDNEDIISKENDVAEIFNSYFIANTLDIADIGNYNAHADDISNPILMAISKYSEHPSIVSIKNNCISDVKHSFSTLSSGHSKCYL